LAELKTQSNDEMKAEKGIEVGTDAESDHGDLSNEDNCLRVSVRELVEFSCAGGDLVVSLRARTSMEEGSRIHRMLQASGGSDYHPERHFSHVFHLHGLKIHLSGRADGIIGDMVNGPCHDRACHDSACHGVATGNRPIEINEIKGVSSIPEDPSWNGEEVHWAQARCYGALHFLEGSGKNESCPDGDISCDTSCDTSSDTSCDTFYSFRLTYCRFSDHLIREFIRHEEGPSLVSFLIELLENYASWLALRRSRICLRNEQIAAAPFPFPGFRAGQRRMAAGVFRAIRDRKTVFIEAPTGTGKTAASIFPGLKALGLSHCERLMFLTAKTSGQQAVLELMRIMEQTIPDLRTIALTAKEKICRRAGGSGECGPDTCHFAKGFFDRLPAALDEASGVAVLDADGVMGVSLNHQVCPFEFSLIAAHWADLIICDYNYAFDPRVSLKSLFLERPGETALLVDEAHNLPDRGRAMFSASLSRPDLKIAEGIMKKLDPSFRDFGRLSRWLLRKGRDALIENTENTENTEKPHRAEMLEQREKEYSVRVTSEAPAGLSEAIASLVDAFSQWSADADNHSRFMKLPKKSRDQVLDAFFSCRDCIRVLESFCQTHRFLWLMDPEDATAVSAGSSSANFSAGSSSTGLTSHDSLSVTKSPFSGSKRNYTKLGFRIFCADPSNGLSNILDLCAGAAIFSATLIPSEYHLDLINRGRGSFESIGSPFPRENLFLGVVGGISSRFRDRQNSSERVLRVIRAVTASRPGNYLVFLPSFSYMRQIADSFEADFPKVDVRIQEPGMDEEARLSFTMAFQDVQGDQPGSTMVAFAVTGGLFGEGIDLPGERLSGVVVVGPGIPPSSVEREIIRDHFDNLTESEGKEVPSVNEESAAKSAPRMLGQRRGFEYSYQYPGFQKVLQSAGRVIRTETDRGVVVLVDDRFLSTRYRKLFPSHWRPVVFSTPEHLYRALNRFW
jgi:Rad3-related DNA helicase